MAGQITSDRAVRRSLPPTDAQRQTLALAASSYPQKLVPIGGGYWVAADSSIIARKALLTGHAIVALRAPYVPTTTIYACTARGWLERCGNCRPAHLDPVVLTEAGRLALESSGA